MTPKEKAEEIIDKYFWIFGDGYLGTYHKQFALILVDEMINEYEIQIIRRGFINPMIENNVSYWKQVKQEIEKL